MHTLITEWAIRNAAAGIRTCTTSKCIAARATNCIATKYSACTATIRSRLTKLSQGASITKT